jgi:DNA mismatch endonuclease (patch repair protein)
MAERGGFRALTPSARSALMARVRSKDTRPELAVRQMAHRLGFRFRLHRRDIPGSPDLAFISKRKVVFVHGCFWHSHGGCALASVPTTRPEYWLPKLERNRLRDQRTLDILQQQRWCVLIVWECQTRDAAALAEKLTNFLRDEAEGYMCSRVYDAYTRLR